MKRKFDFGSIEHIEHLAKVTGRSALEVEELLFEDDYEIESEGDTGDYSDEQRY